MRARVAAAAEQARRKRTLQTPRFRRVMRRRTGSARQRQVEAGIDPAREPGGQTGVTKGVSIHRDQLDQLLYGDLPTMGTSAYSLGAPLRKQSLQLGPVS